MKSVVMLSVVAALLSGCTSWDLGYRWTKAGVAPQQLTLDDVQCRRVAETAGKTPDLVVGGVVDLARVNVEQVQRVTAYDQCMTARGYARARSTNG
jgi:hypothetical protein